MPFLEFTPNLARQVAVPAGEFPGGSVREVLESAFSTRPDTRPYVLDDQGGVRKHVMVFVNGEQIADRRALTDAVQPGDNVFVMQALSGG